MFMIFERYLKKIYIYKFYIFIFKFILANFLMFFLEKYWGMMEIIKKMRKFK